MRTVGPYRLEELLGRGGMGEVWRAVDPRSGQAVALKLFGGLSAVGLDPSHHARFVREAEALSRVEDPGLVKIVAADLRGPVPWMAMELVAGETLTVRLRRGPLPVGEAVGVVAELAGTLARLHARGVVHRDLKPDNVIVTPDGRPVLLDLGIALLLDETARLTASGQVLGTPGYLAPEQAAGSSRETGPWTDIYGLGALLYGLLTGQPPFQGKSVLAILEAVLQRAALPPSHLRPEVEPPLDALVLRCLAKHPVERFPDAASLAAALRDLEPAPPGGPSSRAIAVAIGLVGTGGLAALLLLTPEPTVSAPGPSRAAAVASTAEPTPLERAAALLAAGDVEPARAGLDALVVAEQGNARAWCALAHANLLSNEPEAAEDAAARAIALDRTLARAWAIRSASLSLQNRLEQAAPAAHEALALDPDEPLAHVARALCTGAGDALDRAVELAPADPIARLARAEFRLAKGELQEARDDLQRAAEGGRNFPSRRAAQLLAESHEDAGSLELALEECKRFLARDPEHAPAHQLHARLRCRRGDLAGARADLDRALELDPTSAWLWCDRGEVRRRLGDLAGAAADHRRSLELDPLATAHYGLGEVLLLQGDVEGARREAEAALAIEAVFAPAHLLRGKVLLRSRDVSGALAALWRSVEGLPSPEALVALSTALEVAGDLVAAERHLVEALRTTPDYGPAAVRLAWIRLEQGDLELAARDLELARGLTPDDPLLAVVEARLKARRGDEAGATKDLDRAIARDPSCAPALVERAQVRMKAGDYDGARADLDRAVESGCEPMALVLRGEMRGLQGDGPGAGADIGAALQLRPRWPKALKACALVHMRMGDPAEALADWERVLEEVPDDFNVLMLCSITRAGMGDQARALEDVEAALRLQPDHEGALSHRGRLLQSRPERR